MSSFEKTKDKKGKRERKPRKETKPGEGEQQKRRPHESAPPIDHVELLARYIDFEVVHTAVVIDLTDVDCTKAPVVFSPSVIRTVLSDRVPEGVAAVVFAPKDPAVISAARCSECSGPLSASPLSSSKGRLVVFAGPATAPEPVRKAIAAKLFESILTSAAGTRPRRVHVSTSYGMFEHLRNLTAGWSRARFDAVAGEGIFGISEESGGGGGDDDDEGTWEDPTSVAVSRCRVWLRKTAAAKRPLPTAEEKLANSLRGVCVIRRQVGRAAAAEAVSWLLRNGHVDLCRSCNRPRFSDGAGRITAPANATATLKRAIDWIRGHKHLGAITSNAALRSHITALPVIERVSPTAAIEALVSEGSLRKNPDGTIAIGDIKKESPLAEAPSDDGESCSSEGTSSEPPPRQRQRQRQREAWSEEIVEPIFPVSADELMEPVEESPKDPRESSPINVFHDMQLFREVVEGAEEHGIVAPTPLQQRALPTILAGFHTGFDVVVHAGPGEGKTTTAVLAALTAVLARTPVLQVVIVVQSSDIAHEVAALASSIANRIGTKCLAAVQPFHPTPSGRGGKGAALQPQPQLVVGTCADILALCAARRDMNTVLRMFIVDDAHAVLAGSCGELLDLVRKTFGLSNFPQVVLFTEEMTSAVQSAIPRLIRADPVVVAFP